MFVRIFIYAGCCILLAVSWVITTNSKSTAEKQLILINQASLLTSDGIYVRALPLLEEAAGYDAIHTIAAENELKRVYLALFDNRGVPRKYITLLEKQMSRRDAGPEVFIEAAEHYLSNKKAPEALEVLRNGIAKTGDVQIVTLYENSRYAFETHRPSYDYAAEMLGQTAQVQLEGKWGIAHFDGSIMIPCDYDKISTFSRGQAIVKRAGSIYAINSYNNRIAVAQGDISDFGNFSDNRISLLFEDGWYRATGEFETGTSMFEEIGMYSGGYAAAKVNGRWGVVDLSNDWLVPAEYDEIIQDELGRCFAQGAVFARLGDSVYLITEGSITGSAYEDAHPFSDEGYAAVKKSGKWGFIDTKGVEVIQFIYDDALSFGQHLAAVKIGELWGYISIYGYVVIDAVFYEAKSFSGGSAPVLTDRGWQFITLLEYKRGATL